MKYFFLLLTLLLPFCGEASYKYQLSICAIFQDEGPYLKEWIEYHRLLGVEHFYLYNNSSTDNYKEVLDPYLKGGVVELKDWPSPLDKDWTPYQKKAYDDCLQSCEKETKWLAIIDIDEYIVPHHTDSLIEFLKPYDKKGIGGVKINWQMFGTAGIWEIPQNTLMIECLTKKAIKSCGHNQNQKSIVRPKHCHGSVVHYGIYDKGWKDTLSLNAGPWPHIDEIQINHYWLRNEKFLREVKVPRRARYEGKTWSEETIQAIIKQMNAESDLSIQKFVPALKTRLAPYIKLEHSRT